MIELRLLHSAALRSASTGRNFPGLLSHPKRLAFLTYLALAGRNGPIRRDTLLGVFWPESSEERARNSLNQMVYALRRSLGEDVLVARGVDEIGLDPGAVWCDVVAFERALDAGDLGAALELYEGDLLPGLHVSGSVEFERWLAAERDRLRRRAIDSAVLLAEEEIQVDPAVAVRWLRWAAALDPCDERVLRRLVLVLDALGDRSGAVREFESFRERLATELELEPSPETRALVEEIRKRGDPREGLPGMSVTLPRPVPHWVETRRRSVGAVVVAGAIVAFAVALWGDRSPTVPARAALDAKRVLVATFENRTGDPAMDAIGLMAGDWIAQGLARSGLVRVVPFSTVIRETPYLEETGEGRPGSGFSTLRLANEVGASLMVTGAFYLQDDSIVFLPRLVDVASGEVVRAIDVVSGPVADPTTAVSELRSRVLGSLAGSMDERLASWGDPASQPPTLEAYRSFAEGFDFFGRGGRHQVRPERQDLFLEAAGRFVRAGGTDSTFTAPLLWAVWAYQNAGQPMAAATLVAALEERDGLSSWDRTVLQLHRARIDGDYDGEYEIARRLVDFSPDSEWLFKLGIAAYDSRRYRTAVEAFTRLDPDHGWIAGWPAIWHLRIEARHSLGDHPREIEDVQRLRERFPEDIDLPLLEMMALAGIGSADRVVARFEHELKVDPERALTWLDRVAGELRAHGSPDAASRLLERGIAIERVHPERGSRRGRLAGLLYATGRLDESRAVYRRLADENPNDARIQAALGVIAARRGERDEAERIDRWLSIQEGGTAEDRAMTALRRARIASRLGQSRRAVDLLQESLDAGQRHSYLWFHTLIDLQPLHGDPGFQALLRSRD